MLLYSHLSLHVEGLVYTKLSFPLQTLPLKTESVLHRGLKMSVWEGGDSTSKVSLEARRLPRDLACSLAGAGRLNVAS